MHFALIGEGVPSPSTAGGALANWSIIQYFQKAGHRVTAIIVLPPVVQNEETMIKKRIRVLKETGVAIKIIRRSKPNSELLNGQNNYRIGIGRRKESLRKIFLPSIRDYYPVALLSSELNEILSQVRPDAIYVFDYGPIAAAQCIQVAPRMASLGDPLHLVTRYGMRLKKPMLNRGYVSEVLSSVALSYQVPRWIVNILTGYESVGWFAAQHAAWLCGKGVECHYMHVPVVDLGGPNWEEERGKYLQKSKPRILMLGHLLGTANLTGLGPFLEETVPLLEDELGKEGFEIRMVGRDTPTRALARKLNRPSIQLAGYVEDIAEEFYRADVFLAPAPYPVGVRSRILTSLSFGSCVVTHKLSTLGIPELAHHENALIAENSADLAGVLIKALRDSHLRERLGKRARETYENHFAPEKAGAFIAKELERISQ